MVYIVVLLIVLAFPFLYSKEMNTVVGKELISFINHKSEIS